MNKKQKVILGLVTLLSLVGCGGGSSSESGGETPEPTPTPTPQLTTYVVSVELPEGAVVAQSKPFNPLGFFISEAVAQDVPTSGLSSFEFETYDDAGEVSETITVTDDNLVDNGDGTYQLSIEGEPAVDRVIVAVANVDSVSVRLKAPAVAEGSSDAPSEVSAATTAATQQYISAVAESGGFSAIEDTLTLDEVDQLIDNTVEQVTSIPLPEGVDSDDINQVIESLEGSAEIVVQSQLEIAVAPEPASGELEAFAGEYHGSLFGPEAFAHLDNSILSTKWSVADFTFFRW